MAGAPRPSRCTQRSGTRPEGSSPKNRGEPAATAPRGEAGIRPPGPRARSGAGAGGDAAAGTSDGAAWGGVRGRGRRRRSGPLWRPQRLPGCHLETPPSASGAFTINQRPFAGAFRGVVGGEGRGRTPGAPSGLTRPRALRPVDCGDAGERRGGVSQGIPPRPAPANPRRRLPPATRARPAGGRPGLRSSARSRGKRWRRLGASRIRALQRCGGPAAGKFPAFCRWGH